MTSTVIYAPDGTVTGVRHAWTFDDMFSTFAIQGLESKQKGVFTREELQPLAEVNVTSLKEYEYFSYAKANGKKTQFIDPVDYHLELKDSLLTLHFTLPLKTPMKAQSLDLIRAARSLLDRQARGSSGTARSAGSAPTSWPAGVGKILPGVEVTPVARVEPRA